MRLSRWNHHHRLVFINMRIGKRERERLVNNNTHSHTTVVHTQKGQIKIKKLLGGVTYRRPQSRRLDWMIMSLTALMTNLIWLVSVAQVK
jgi:hypothetical protein